MVCFSGYVNEAISDLGQPIQTKCSSQPRLHARSRGVNEANLVELTKRTIETISTAGDLNPTRAQGEEPPC